MQLSEALRETARRLEADEVDYKWLRMQDCNCGVLAQTLLGMTSEDITTAMQRFKNAQNEPDRNGIGVGVFGTWGDAITCATGLPEGSIIWQCEQAGMTKEDFFGLEYLADPAVRSRAGLPPLAVPTEGVSLEMRHKAMKGLDADDDGADFGTKSHVIKYMRAWADMLDEREKAGKIS